MLGTTFQITHDAVELLKAGQITELPAHKAFYPFFPKEQLQGLFAIFELWFENGSFDLKPENTLNDAFPSIKPKSVNALLEEAWGNKVDEVAQNEPFKQRQQLLNKWHAEYVDGTDTTLSPTQ